MSSTWWKCVACMAVTFAMGVLCFRLPWYGALTISGVSGMWADYIRDRNA